MKPLVLSALLVVCSFSFGQFNYFVYHTRRILSTTDIILPVVPEKPGTDRVNTFQDSVTTLDQIMHYVTHTSGKKGKVECSSILMQLSDLTAKRYASLEKANNRKWRTVRKQLMRSFIGSKCKFGVLSVYSFTIPLVKTHGDFYYDKNGPDGEYNLYDGKRKPKPVKEGEEEPEVHALKYYTEAELMKMIDRKIRRSRARTELSRGICSYYGFSVSIDKRTLHSGNKVPRARVVVILGSKRLKMVKKKLPKPSSSSS